MTTVDAAERSVVSRAPIAPGDPSARSQDVFSAVFESARQAGQMRADASIRQEQTTLLSSRLSETEGAGRHRVNELEEADRRQRQHEPGRVDRLREQQNQQDAADFAPRTGQLTDQQPNPSQQWADAQRQDARGEDSFAADPTVNRQHQVAEGRADSAERPAQFLPDAGATPKGPSDSSRNPTVFVDQLSTPTTPGDAARAGQVVVPNTASQAVTAVRAQSGVGDPSFGTQGSNAKAAAGQAGESQGRAGATSMDFQSVLETAGRTRQQLGMVRRPGSAGAVARGVSRGVNLNQPGSITDLARLVRSTVGPRHSSMVLRLDPPNMGQLRIDVQMHQQELSVRIEATTHAGQEMLQSRLHDLRAALEQQGVHVHQIDIELRAPATSPAPGDQGQDPLASDMSSGDQASHTEQGGKSTGNGEQVSRDATDNEAGAAAALNDVAAAEGEETIEVLATAEPGVDLVI